MTKKTGGFAKIKIKKKYRRTKKCGMPISVEKIPNRKDLAVHNQACLPILRILPIRPSSLTDTDCFRLRYLFMPPRARWRREVSNTGQLYQSDEANWRTTRQIISPCPKREFNTFGNFTGRNFINNHRCRYSAEYLTEEMYRSSMRWWSARVATARIRLVLVVDVIRSSAAALVSVVVGRCKNKSLVLLLLTV
jgi:hypothetical protein